MIKRDGDRPCISCRAFGAQRDRLQSLRHRYKNTEF